MIRRIEARCDVDCCERDQIYGARGSTGERTHRAVHLRSGYGRVTSGRDAQMKNARNSRGVDGFGCVMPGRVFFGVGRRRRWDLTGVRRI